MRKESFEGSEKICDEAHADSGTGMEGGLTGATYKEQDTVRLCCPYPNQPGSRDYMAIEKHSKIVSKKSSRIIWILVFILACTLMISIGAFVYKEVRVGRQKKKTKANGLRAEFPSRI